MAPSSKFLLKGLLNALASDFKASKGCPFILNFNMDSPARQFSGETLDADGDVVGVLQEI